MKTKTGVLLGIAMVLAFLWVRPGREGNGFRLDPRIWCELLKSDRSPDRSGRVVGPHGEPVVTVSGLAARLGSDQLSRLRQEGYTAAICMQGIQDVRNDWSRLQVEGLRRTFEHLGIRVLAVTDGEFEVEKQIADYRHVITLRPDVIVTIPLDTAKCAPVLKEAADGGIKLILMDNIPDSFAAGKDYVGMVMADSYANGWLSGELLVRHLEERGTVALIHWRNRMYTCDERSRGVRDALRKHPAIRIVSEDYFDGIYDIDPLVRRILAQHPDLNGLWVVWDTPALEAVKVIRELRRRVAVTTVDLSQDSAREIAAGDILLGCGVQHPYHQGVAEALMAGVALCGSPTPPFVVIPGMLVTRENLAEAWRRIFLQDVPGEVIGLPQEGDS